MIRRCSAAFAVLMLASIPPALLSASPVAKLADSYLESYFEMFPTLATAAARHDFDESLEDLSPQRLKSWIEFNTSKRVEILELLARSNDLSFDDQLDGEVLPAQT